MTTPLGVTDLIAGYAAYTTSDAIAADLDAAPAVRSVIPTTGPVTTWPTTVTVPPAPSITLTA